MFSALILADENNWSVITLMRVSKYSSENTRWLKNRKKYANRMNSGKFFPHIWLECDNVRKVEPSQYKTFSINMMNFRSHLWRIFEFSASLAFTGTYSLQLRKYLTQFILFSCRTTLSRSKMYWIQDETCVPFRLTNRLHSQRKKLIRTEFC